MVKWYIVCLILIKVKSLASNQQVIKFLTQLDQHLIVGCDKFIYLYNVTDYLEPRFIKAHNSLIISLKMLVPDSIN